MRKRLLTAALAIPIALGAVFCSHLFPISLLAIVVTAVSLWELGRFFNLRAPLLGMAVLLAAIMIATLRPPGGDRVVMLASLLLLQGVGVFFALRCIRHPNSIDAAVASLWVACPLSGLVLFHATDPKAWRMEWLTPLLLILLPLWAGDTAAIFGGQAFGGPLLAPGISPKKTLSGAYSNFIAAVLVGGGVAFMLDLPLWIGLASGVLVGVLGQAGDLFESFIKRQAGVKDSGGILPGHGGILDRIDSLLFTALPVALLVTAYQLVSAPK